MKFLLPVIAIAFLASCKSNMVTHRKTFSPSKGKGEWTDYYRTVRKGETPMPKRELKDR